MILTLILRETSLHPALVYYGEYQRSLHTILHQRVAHEPDHRVLLFPSQGHVTAVIGTKRTNGRLAERQIETVALDGGADYFLWTTLIVQVRHTGNDTLRSRPLEDALHCFYISAGGLTQPPSLGHRDTGERTRKIFPLASVGPMAMPLCRLLWYDAHTSNLEEGVHADVCLASACFDDGVCPVQPPPPLRR